MNAFLKVNLYKWIFELRMLNRNANGIIEKRLKKVWFVYPWRKGLIMSFKKVYLNFKIRFFIKYFCSTVLTFQRYGIAWRLVSFLKRHNCIAFKKNFLTHLQYFTRFLSCFPTIDALNLITFWEGFFIIFTMKPFLIPIDWYFRLQRISVYSFIFFTFSITLLYLLRFHCSLFPFQFFVIF